MIDASQTMESPSGLELNPEPPSTARISKKVGIAVLGIVLVVGVLVVYGLYARREQQQIAQTQSAEKHPESARNIGDQLVKELAPPAVANPAPVFPSRSGDASQGIPSSEPGTLQPPRLVYRDDGQEAPTGNYGPVDSSRASSTAQPELSAEEKLRLAAFRQEQEAMAAPTPIRGGNAGPSSTATPAVSDTLQQFASMLGAGKPATASDSSINGAIRTSHQQGGNDYDQQNEQQQKQAFIEQARGRAFNNYLKSTRTLELGRYEIKMGWDIPAILEQGINSDLPGEVKALVRSSVYDTATGKYLLIPQGSRLVGIYDSQISYGQNRLQVVWSRIIYPDGSSINLDGMSGQDSQGMSGFHDKVDNHYKRLIGSALLTSAFVAGISLSQRQNTSLLTTPTAGQTATSALGQQLGELGTEITRKNLSIQPTVKIPIGYLFNVRVNKDILFEAPYVPAEL
jgi:type IV secretion system protein TrbI